MVYGINGALLNTLYDISGTALNYAYDVNSIEIFADGGEEQISVDTTAIIDTENYGLNMSGGRNSYTGLGITQIYHFQQDVVSIMASSGYDATNDYITVANIIPRITLNRPNTKFFELYPGAVGTGNVTKTHVYTEGDVYSTYSSGDVNYGSRNTADWRVTGVAFTLYLPDIDDSYAFWTPSETAIYPVGVRAGDVVFAGKNTEYYGLANIDGTKVGEDPVYMTLDKDVLMDFIVKRQSIIGEEPMANTQMFYGISEELAALLDDAKKEWMIEYGGDSRKIPLIVSTDQHGRRNAGIFNYIGKTFSLHDVSKICNLGDTVAVEWVDADQEHPLLSDATLEAWCESIKEIPFSKRLDVYGNHDACYYDGYSVSGNPIGTRYPSSMAHLDQYFRNIYAKRNNNHGWSAIIDDYFNVKYMIVTGFEWIDGRSNSRISTAQMNYIIDEFSKNDGYDIVVMSHVPLYNLASTDINPTGQESTDALLYRFSAIDTDALFNARKNKTSGSITDSEGIVHNYDFTNCTSDILCGLSGHMHRDCYNYTGGVGSGLLSNSFDWFANNEFFFLLVDRVNRYLNIWKIEGDALTYQNYQVPFDKVVV